MLHRRNNYHVVRWHVLHIFLLKRWIEVLVPMFLSFEAFSLVVGDSKIESHKGSEIDLLNGAAHPADQFTDFGKSCRSNSALRFTSHCLCSSAMADPLTSTLRPGTSWPHIHIG